MAAQVATSVGLLHAAEQSIAADQERIKDDLRQMSATPQRLATVQASEADESLIFGDDHAGKWTRALAKIGVSPERLSNVAGWA